MPDDYPETDNDTNESEDESVIFELAEPPPIIVHQSAGDMYKWLKANGFKPQLDGDWRIG